MLLQWNQYISPIIIVYAQKVWINNVKACLHSFYNVKLIKSGGRSVWCSEKEGWSTSVSLI